MTWEEIEKKIHHVPMPPKALRMLYSFISKEQAEQVGTIYAQIAFPIEIQNTNGKPDVNQFLELFETWVSKSHFSMVKNSEGDKTKFVITHDLGENFSYCLAKYVKTRLENLEETTRVTIGDDSVSIVIKLK